MPTTCGEMAFQRSSAAATGTDEDIDRKIQVRKTRQARLVGTDAPNYRAILNEAVLYRSPGEPGVMKTQLEYLHERME
jgi:Domain of unknown function (DUF5753)